MADNFEHRRIVLLLDGVSEDGTRLVKSLTQAGYGVDAVNMRDPDRTNRYALSIPEYLLGYKRAEKLGSYLLS